MFLRFQRTGNVPSTLPPNDPIVKFSGAQILGFSIMFQPLQNLICFMTYFTTNFAIDTNKSKGHILELTEGVLYGSIINHTEISHLSLLRL